MGGRSGKALKGVTFPLLTQEQVLDRAREKGSIERKQHVGHVLRQKREGGKELKEDPGAEQRGAGRGRQNLQGISGVGKGLGFYPKNHDNYLRTFMWRRNQVRWPFLKAPLVPFCGK